MIFVRKKLPGILAALLMAPSLSHAQTPVLETTQLVAATASADAQAPAEVVFTIQTAGSYTLTLNDLQLPARHASLRAIVTQDLRVVADAALNYSGATPATQTSETFFATPGIYRILVVGEANDEERVGAYAVQVAASGGAPLASGSGAFTSDGGPPDGVSVLETTFAISQAGAYDFAATDHQFPAALADFDAAVFAPGGGAPLATLNLSTPAAPFTAAAGQYTLRVIARAAAPQLAGLYGLRVGNGGGDVYRSVQAAGRMAPASTVSNVAAGSLTITRDDLELPEAMSSYGVAVVQSGALLQVLSGDGARDVSVIGGQVELFINGAPSEVGAFSLRASQGAQVRYADVVAVDASPDPASATMYIIHPQQPVAAGAYRVLLTDLRFPVQFNLLDAVVTQGDQALAMLDAPGAANVTLANDRVQIFVAARANAAGAAAQNALFSVALHAQPGGAEVLQTTQGVGGLFRTQLVQIPAAGPYDVRLVDLEFPARLRTNAIAVTRGAELIGQIFGGGTLRGQQLEQGAYALNFIGQPAADEPYGAYGLKVSQSPPRPTITFSTSPASITSGERTTLQWTATNATSCTASGGWTGPKAASGSEQSAALNTNASFDLSCTGPGGSASATASVAVNPPTPSRGGGGAFGAFLLIYMSGLWAAAWRLRVTQSWRGRHASVRQAAQAAHMEVTLWIH